ncbi:MAG: copper chaperone PCu(A)C [Alphaproteobacteria bacterium]|nr:copper chaperone PCu(A)C [Alphaproteobacteria bacterium]
MQRIPGYLALAFVLAACQPQDLVVANPEFRPPLGTGAIGAGYFSIRSPEDDRIVAVSSQAAARVEMHASTTTGQVTRMERADGVDLPAGQTVKFEPGGLHLMVFSPEVKGDATFPITFEFRSGRRMTVGFGVVTAAPEPHD